MKKILLIVVLFVLINRAQAQQYALFNTRTLFDSFENPAQKGFALDSSRQYLSNFLIPYLDVSSLNKGNSNTYIRNLVNQGYQQNRTGNFKDPRSLREEVNIYLAALRIFKYHRFAAEMGFSWQIRAFSTIEYDEKISRALFQVNAKDFLTIPRSNIFNNNGKMFAYHQFGFSYRENYDKKWAFGFKLSLLSGIGYADFYASKSNVSIIPAQDQMNLSMKGTYRLNYPANLAFKPENIFSFKNLGAALSFGLSHSGSDGVLVMANLKDLGFIRWGKRSVQANFDETRTFSNITGSNADKNLSDAMEKIGSASKKEKAFTETINSKIDLLIAKNFGAYHPNIILTKDIFDKYGELALVNTFKTGLFSFSAVPTINTDKDFKLGMQGMIQSPNFEMFLGTNDIIGSYYATKELLKNNSAEASSYHRGSVYLGMAFKIGYVVEHPQNMSWMPGVGVGKEKPGLFIRLFSIFKKKN